GKSMAPRLGQQPGFDLGFANAVLADRPPRLLFRDRNLDARTVHPDRAAMQELLHAPAQRLDELLRAFQRVRREIDNAIGLQVAALRAEGARSPLGGAIERDGLDFLPGRMRDIRLSLAAARVNHGVPRFDEPGRQVGADMSGAADDYDSHRRR